MLTRLAGPQPGQMQLYSPDWAGQHAGLETLPWPGPGRRYIASLGVLATEAWYLLSLLNRAVRQDLVLASRTMTGPWPDSCSLLWPDRVL